MRRLALVACLIFNLLLTGCAGRRHAMNSPLDRLHDRTTAGVQATERWLEDKPVLKACAVGMVIAGAAALIAGLIILAAQHDDHHESNNQWSPAFE